jgi:hypothetical protein
MRKKFTIHYPADHRDPEKAGKKYVTTGNDMLVMCSSGVFFLYNWGPYYPSIKRLSDVIGNYDVRWS